MTHRSANSSYGHLSEAWIGNRTIRVDDRGAARTGSAAPPPWPRASADHAPRVLVARHLRRPGGAFDSGLVASSSRVERVYRIDPVSASSISNVGDRCRVDTPRLVLIDLALLRCAAAHAMDHLRNRMPATDWLIVGDEPLTALEVTPRSWARGCLDWSVDAATLPRALDAVMAGRLWFPRALTESLYLALLGSGTPAIASEAPRASPSGGPGLGDEPLTTRETEVLALMRRGLTNKQIAGRLDISANTVKKHLAHVFDKRGLHSRRQEFE